MMSAIRKVMASVVSLSVLLPSVAQAGPILDWLCHKSPPVVVTTTYAPAYVAPVVAAAPATGCSTCAAQTTYYAPVVVSPAPVTAYRLLPVVPRPVTTYPTVAAYNPYSAAPVTVYRPVVPVVPTTRLLPYTSYRMVYPTVAYYAPTVSYVSAPAPCNTCGVPAPSYSPPVSAPSSDASMEAPSLPPAQPSTTYYEPPPASSTIVTPMSTSNNSPTPAYQQNKPATGAEPNSAPAGEPKLLSPEKDPQDRTTMRPMRQISHEVTLPAPPTVRVLSEDLWQAAND
jgi:hypothetical protein